MADSQAATEGSDPTQEKQLFNEHATDFDAALLEQYKLYVETANTTSTTRVQANNFFLTINSVLIGLVVGVVEFANRPVIPIWIFYACVVGIGLAISWYILIRSYRDLNSARFIVIQELETRLPANIYKREWDIALSERPKRRYIRQTDIEQIVPLGFVALYILLAIITTFSAALGIL